MAVGVGDKVLLPEYGGTKFAFEDKVSGIFYDNHDFLYTLCLGGWKGR